MARMKLGVAMVIGLAAMVGLGVLLWNRPPSGKAPSAEAPPVEASTPPPEPEGPEAPVQVQEREGVKVAFSLRPLNGGQEVRAREEATATISLTDARTGEPLKGLRPYAWMSPRQKGDPAPDEAACKSLAREFLSGLLGQMPDVNMNAYYLLTLNHDNTISAIDPQVAFSRTKLLSLISLPGSAADWALHPDKNSLFVTIPGAGKVTLVDTERLKVRGSVNVGKAPTRVAVSPDGRFVFVANDGDGTISVVDPKEFEVHRTVEVGPGHHELAFTEGGRTLWVSSSDGEELHVIDVDKLEATPVQVGKGISSIAASDTAGALFATNALSGELLMLDARARQVSRRVPLKKGVSRIAFDPTGRWAFVLNRGAGTVTVVDASTGNKRHEVGGIVEPDALAFTAASAYVRGAGQEKVVMVQLDTLPQAGTPMVVHVPMFQKPATKSRGVGIASPFAPTPEGASVLIASPGDNVVSYYREGLMAASGTHRNYGREPRGAMILDRSLHEVGPGAYATTVKPSVDGTYDAVVLLDNPRAAICFEQQVQPSTEPAEREGPRVELKPLFDPKKKLPEGAEALLRFSLVDTESKKPVPAEQIRVLLFRPPGTWQLRPAARALADGTFEVPFTPPTPGQYQFVVGTNAPGSGLGSIRPITLGVTSKEKK
ncbi:MAG: YncE family protein [Myxococcaceae bacterium]